MKIEELLKDFDSHEIYVCSVCGSPEIEEKYWCNVTTGVPSEVDDNNEVLCLKCESFIDNTMTLKEYKRRTK